MTTTRSGHTFDSEWDYRSSCPLTSELETLKPRLGVYLKMRTEGESDKRDNLAA